MTAKGPLSEQNQRALELIETGLDNINESRPPFVSLSHALRWYAVGCERHGGIESMLGKQVQVYGELGAQVQRGHRPDRQEAELWLMARVSACLPRPRGQEPAILGKPGFQIDEWNEEWLIWRAFLCAMMGYDFAEVARRLEQWSGKRASWKQARGWVQAGFKTFAHALRSRRLLE